MNNHALNLKLMRLSLTLTFLAFTLLIVVVNNRAFAQSSGDYRTATSGNWNSASTWERYNGSSWVASPSQGAPTSSMGAITVLNTHTVAVTANVTLDQVTVNSGGQLAVNSGVTLIVRNGSGTDLTVSGIVKSAGTINRQGTIVFNSGGKYQHNFTTTAGTIPTATWNTGSTCEVIGYTSLATMGNIGLGQSFYNFTWNCPNQANTLSMAGGLKTVNGDLSIISTGTGVLQFANTISSNLTVAVAGDFTQSGGIFTLLGSSGNSTTLTVAGDFTISGGTFQRGGGTGSVAFNGTSVQTFSKSGGTISGAINFTVNSGAIVDFGTSVLDGSTGTFTLSSGASIVSSHANGLSSTGSIQTTSKSFNSGANYQFKGASTGTFTTTTANTVNNLTINGSGTTLAQNFNVNGTLALTSGILTLSTYNLTVASSGSITKFSSSAYIKTNSTGQLKRTVGSSSVVFPVGNSSYNPITLTNAGTSDVYGIRVADGTIPATINDAAQSVNRRWIITEAVSNGGNLSVSAQYNSSEEGASFVAGTNTYIGFYNGSSWTQTAATQSGSNPYTFSSSSGFSSLGNLTTGTQYFAVGKDNAFIAPTKLVITSVLPASPTVGSSFSVTVQSQTSDNQVSAVSSATSFTLSNTGAAGSLSGTVNGTIPAGSSSVTVSGAILSSAGTANFTATRTSGMSLAAGSTTFSVLPNSPTVQASSISFSSVNSTGMTISWAAGNGSNSLVVIKASSEVNSDPVDAITYTANATFGSGSQLGAGNYVVYNSTGTSVDVTGLTAGVEYFVAVYSFNNTNSIPNYLTTSPATSSQRSFSTNDYRSAASGAWSTVTTWQRWNGSSWQTPTSGEGVPSSSDGFITILSGHTVTVSANTTIDQVTINAGGQITISGNSYLRINAGSDDDLIVNGTILNNSTETSYYGLRINSGATIAVGSGGKYQHGINGGTVPTATWEDGSTCEITGFTTFSGNPTGGFGQNFYHFTWNSLGQTSAGLVSLAGALVTVRGNLTITSTGSGNLQLANNATATLDVTGNFTQTGGTFILCNTSGTITLNIGGTFNMSGGTLQKGSGNGNIYFDGTSTQSFIKSGGTISGAINFNVKTGATLDFGSSVLNGSSGTFTLSNGAGLVTANTAGITSSGATGSVQVTGTRTYNTGANYTYNGSSAQATGNGLPSSVNDLTINNSAGVNLSSSCIVEGILTLTSGVFNIGTTTLTLESDISKTGGTLSSSATGTVVYNQSTDGQTVISGTYGNLTFSNRNKIFESTSYNTDGSLGTSNIVISGTFNAGNSNGHDAAESIVTFNSGSAQDVPASINYFSVYLSGTGTKTIKGAGQTQFKVNWNIDVSAPVSFDNNISSIYISKNLSGNQPFSAGAIPITIGDDWKNTATGYSHQGLVTYNGENGQTVEVGPLNYKNLTITASRGAAYPVTTSLIRGAVAVSGVLTVEPYCDFVTNSNLTLLASDGANANVAPLLGGAKVSGDVNVQTFIKGGSSSHRGTRAMCAPISSSNIYEQLKSYLIVTGPSGVAGGFDPGGAGQPYGVTIANYKESNLPTQTAFEPVQALAEEANPPGVGFLFFFRGNRANPSSKLNSPYAAPENVTLVYKGPINQGDIDVEVPNSDNPGDAYNGYQLVGNPYPSTIDFQALLAGSSGINSIITIVRAGQSAAYYSAALDSSANGGARYIQPGQAFYVKSVSGGGILRFSEDVKVTGESIKPGRLLSRPEHFDSGNLLLSKNSSPAIIKSNNSNSSAKILRISLQDTQNKEEALIGFRNDFLAEADINDAQYFAGTTVNLSTLSSDNVQLAINTMPDFKDVKEIALSVNASASGQLKLNFANVPVPSDYTIFLKDNYLNTLTDIRTSSEYAFSIDKNVSNSFGNERFSLVITPVSTLPFKVKSLTARKISSGAELKWLTVSEANSSHFKIERSADGKNFQAIGLVNAAGTSSATLSYNFIDTAPQSGANYYRLQIVDKDGLLSYSEVIVLSYSSTDDNQGISIYPNPVVDVLTVNLGGSASVQNIQLSTFDLQGRRLLSTEGSNKQDVSSLIPGNYIIQINDKNTGMALGRLKFIKK